jgi:hypothetical protein
MRTIASGYWNYSTPNNYQEDSADLIGFSIYISDAANAKDVTLMFGMTAGADPFKTDRYEFALGINGVPLQDIPGAMPSIGNKLSLFAVPMGYKYDAAAKAKTTTVQTVTDPSIKPGSTGDEGWNTIAIPRGAFKRVGANAGLGWSTIRAVKLVFQAKKAGGIVRYDDLRIISGGTSFFGTYRIRLRRARDANGWVELSPASSESASVFLSLQNATAVIPSSELVGSTNALTGWTDYWVYMQGGALDQYYKVGEFSALGAGDGMRIDEFSRTSSNTPGLSKRERTRFVDVGFSGPGLPVEGNPTDGLVATIAGNEADILIRNQYLDNFEVPDGNMIDCDNFLSRMLELTATHLKYSPIGMPSVFYTDFAIEVGSPSEVPYWIRRTRNALFVGTSKDIIRVSGTGQVDGTTGLVDFTAARLNLGKPPIGPDVTVDGNTIFYRAEEGWMLFDGETAVPLDKGNNTLLWRGFTRQGILPVAIGGRHRAAVNDGFFYSITPHGTFSGGSTAESRDIGMRLDEFSARPDNSFSAAERSRWVNVGFTIPSGGDSNVIWRNRIGTAQWDRMVMPVAMRAIFVEPDGTLVAGGVDGYVYSLLHPDRADHTEAQAGQGVNLDTPILVTLHTPAIMPNMFGRCDLNEVQAYVKSDSGCSPVLGGGGLYVDGQLRESFGLCGPGGFGFYRRQFLDTIFRSAQLKFSVTARQYSLKGIRLNYQLRPPSQVCYDSGLILPTKDNDLVALDEFRMLSRLFAPCYVRLYLNDEILGQDQLITPEDSGLRPYKARYPRNAKGYATRVVVYSGVAESTADNHAMEMYWAEIAFTISGNEDDNTHQKSLPL